MKKILIQESDTGMIFRFEKLPSNLFEFYILKTKRFKDRTHSYKICVGLAGDTKKCWTLKTIRGHKSDAIKALETIIRTGTIT